VLSNHPQHGQIAIKSQRSDGRWRGLFTTLCKDSSNSRFSFAAKAS
jgi:hypothetical protein